MKSRLKLLCWVCPDTGSFGYCLTPDGWVRRSLHEGENFRTQPLNNSDKTTFLEKLSTHCTVRSQTTFKACHNLRKLVDLNRAQLPKTDIYPFYLFQTALREANWKFFQFDWELFGKRRVESRKDTLYMEPSLYYVSKRTGWVGSKNGHFCWLSVLYLCWRST